MEDVVLHISRTTSGAVTGTNYVDSTATNGTTYYYKVAAVNSAGTSGMSNEASATPIAQTVPSVRVMMKPFGRGRS